MATPNVCILCKVHILVFLLPASVLPASNLRVDVGLFSQNDISGWEIREFAGATDYSLKLIDGKQVLLADSRQSASAFYKKIRIDLDKTPILNWSWRKQQAIDPGNELEKKGDDYVARIYVMKSGGLFFWNTLVLNYVWSYQHKRHDTWNNPFAGKKEKMLALRDASDAQGIWFKEQRNLVIDFKQLHGIEVGQIDGVAIMTDSDNSGLSARAVYGDIFFSSGAQ